MLLYVLEASYGIPYMNISWGRAAGDGIFTMFRRSATMVFTRPLSALRACEFLADISMIFISKKK